MAASRSKVTYFLLIVLFGFILVAFSDIGKSALERAQSSVGYKAKHAKEASTVSVKTTGEALIGGNFSLTDTQGETVTQDDLKGSYSIVFFGFSNCPDMCPTALSVITTTLESLPETTTSQIKPVFISVDPERDTQEKLAEYAANFHPSLIALTGTKEEVDQAANAFKVFFSKAEVMKDSDGNYMVNHSGYLYLMDKEGKYVKHFPHTVTAEDLAISLKEVVGE